MKELRITQAESGQRLDKLLLKYLNKASKGFIYKMLRKKRIKLNGSRAEGSEILSIGDCITFYLAEETMDSFMEERIIKAGYDKIVVIFEDENILICNKPAGVLSHPESSTDSDTMIDRILLYLHNKGSFSSTKDSTFTPAICNRLDRNTSGLLLCGKNLAAVQSLNKIIADKKLDKFYMALVYGRVDSPGVLTGFHSKSKKNNKAVIRQEKCNSTDKEVITEYSPVIASEKLSLLEIKLITGKPHQIRAHLSSIGHSLLGDIKYGASYVSDDIVKSVGAKYQMLHAYKIRFNEPNGYLGYLYKKEFECKPPKSFDNALNMLNGGNK